MSARISSIPLNPPAIQLKEDSTCNSGAKAVRVAVWLFANRGGFQGCAALPDRPFTNQCLDKTQIQKT